MPPVATFALGLAETDGLGLGELIGFDDGVGVGDGVCDGDGDGDRDGDGFCVGEIFCDAACVATAWGDDSFPFGFKLLAEFNKMNPILRTAMGIMIKIGMKPCEVLPTIKV